MSQLPNFRKMSIDKRREALNDVYGTDCRRKTGFMPSDITGGIDMDLADVMVENAVGFFQLPLGIVQDIQINGRLYDVPLVTEEPSVIAAAQYGARLLSSGTGIQITLPGSVMTAQIFFSSTDLADIDTLLVLESLIKDVCEPLLASMNKRGGGWNSFRAVRIDADKIKCEIDVDVCDAMGANLLNSLAEAVAVCITERTGLNKIMAILSNKGDGRVGKAEVCLPLKLLRRRGIDSEVLARRLQQASEIARADSDRAVTHNKGIMNGVSAFALATGNDTRALEAAVHAYAAKSGAYQGLSTYRYDSEKQELNITLEMPMPLATVGGAAGYHPGAILGLDICGAESAAELAGIGLALGLAQNFAALSALVSEGIQEGHMGLHARRIAYAAGARGVEIENLSQLLVKGGQFNKTVAKSLLQKLRGSK